MLMLYMLEEFYIPCPVRYTAALSTDGPMTNSNHAAERRQVRV